MNKKNEFKLDIDNWNERSKDNSNTLFIYIAVLWSVLKMDKV